MNFRRVSVFCVLSSMLVGSAVYADVKTERKTKFELPGILGGLVKTFGGKSARQGVISKIAVKGDRKMSVNEDTAELVDLAQEKFYLIDMKNKTYTVRTFEEIRRQMQEAMTKAQSAPAAKPAESTTQEKPPEYTVDFNIKESGEKKNINGFDAREVVTTITVREKDKKAEDGSMVLTSSMWLAPRIDAMKELEDFDRRVAEKLLLPFAADLAQQMGPAMATYPGLKEAMGKLQTEKVNMDGTSVLTVVRAEILGNPDQGSQAPQAQQSRQPEIPKSLGGLLGGLGRKAAAKDNNNPPASKSASLMTMNEELISVTTTVSEADVAIPAGFKEKK